MNDQRQPILNAPWPAVLVTLSIVLGYGFQSVLLGDLAVRYFAFSSMALAAGRWETIFTSMLLHGNWAHALMNAGFALAFGTPVARYFGARPRGVAVFVLFYLVSGAVACLGYAGFSPGGLLIGASGAVAGLVGGSTRLMAGHGVPGPFLSRPVISMTVSWVALNLIFGFIGFAPGMGAAKIGWEAHIFGYAAGLFLIDLFGRLARGPETAPAFGEH
ncbi:rhomboid family intramembrane serine protease [Phenylobacterium sp.]|uniref:rhomboid family intramembrane serine protease n=1 Tax=Phenylobacterium sp. TaxID=1871053 RepID=UPI00273332D6|nr:rhomboid family intramembrane serine protease [Phenylobacterium sp.]MDP3853992.1 rhomboid family intramembrane serine protease [Phenylobacterium sp.]